MNYHELIDDRRDEIVEFLREIIKVPSVLGEAKEGAPFGEAVAEVYGRLLERARADGFDVFDADGWGGHIELAGTSGGEDDLDVADGELAAGEAAGDAESTAGPVGDTPRTAGRVLGIPVHLDVVPAGGAWVHGPFDADIADGRIYGRGTSDDKGPAAAVYLALKALKDSGFTPSKTVRIIIGLDEETGWIGMNKYLEVAGLPDFGFSPDGDFPAVNGEMGVINFDLAKKLSKDGETGISVRSVTGGNAPNMVPDGAKAIITEDSGKGFNGVKEKVAEYRASSGYRLTGRGIGKSFEIHAHGVSAHGSTPDKGLNASSRLLEFLGTLELAND
ncbi:MAG: Sapep family Mn(2+)-dependent dipeptidase, partial [Clostridiales Family XIII bacterium]|nr:Sapep family Mn(2+)-dependent dipeptidase [Clostridiales Family XIII bacterium]